MLLRVGTEAALLCKSIKAQLSRVAGVCSCSDTLRSAVHVTPPAASLRAPGECPLVGLTAWLRPAPQRRYQERAASADEGGQKRTEEARP